MFKQTKKAFTLVELLVVISIIALLLAILLPSLSLAREHAKKTVCAAHLGQMGIAHNAYAISNGGSLVDRPPATRLPNGNRLDAGIWRVYDKEKDILCGSGKLIMQGYCSDAKVAYCPSFPIEGYGYDEEPYGWPADNDIKNVQGPYIFTSYHYRCTFGPWSSKHHRGPFVSLILDQCHPAKNTEPGYYAIMADCFTHDLDVFNVDPAYEKVVSHSKLDGYNVLYLGGEVTFYRDRARKVYYTHIDSYAFGFMEKIWRDIFSSPWEDYWFRGN